jgi:hypothetical protein
MQEKINVLFLDYDGVVNVPMWNENGTKCSYGYPSEGKVNSFQACQWVSEFCQKCNFQIVVISTWRKRDNYKECLYNGGLRKNVEVIGKTESLYPKTRGDEIRDWLSKHSEVDKFIIFDDELIDGLEDKQIHCAHSCGFGESEFHQAVQLINTNKK